MALFECVSGSSGGGATITVTYSSDFYGETVTCSHGTKTYSKVATSSGTLEFSVDEEGTWTISSMGFSDTADVVLSYPAELVSIPDGETVLPTDDIETWLACAGITDKAYTTLSQVLGDSETFNALLGDSNACAYMKRSTTWSTDICADQYAMNLLGQYDTACDALLSDATWASAIANSTYWESVLNVIVPTMTGYTTPSGEVFPNNGSQTYSWWHAFDNDISTRDEVSYTTYDNRLGYKFPSSVKCVVAKIGGYPWQSATYKLDTYKIVASKNNSTWVELTDTITNNVTASGQIQTVIFTKNIDDYLYYAIHVLTSGSSSDLRVQIESVQFYGRTTSSEKVHGANGESAYILDGGSPVTITDPSTLDVGTYTVYSTVAKNPSDLSADYSKTIRICPNTKEIVVRPDGALYWYGSKVVAMQAYAIQYETYGTATAPSITTNSTTVVASESAGNLRGVYATTSKIDLSGSNKLSFIVTGYGASGGGVSAVLTDNVTSNFSSTLGQILNGDGTTVSTPTLKEFTISATNKHVGVFVVSGNSAGSIVTLHAIWHE